MSKEHLSLGSGLILLLSTTSLVIEIQGFDIVQFLMGPADILTQGLVGLILGLGMNALQIWLMYEIVTIIPPRSKNLIDAIDMELSQVQYFSGLKYRVYSAVFQLFLPLVLICICYLSFCLLTSTVTTLF